MANRTIIIGDIHSCADELFELLEVAEVDDQDTVVAAGDMFDRGPDPWAVYEYFSGAPNRLAVMGNHERKHVRRIYSPSQKITRLQLGEKRYRTVREWMTTLPLWLDLPEALVVHNAYVPGIPMEEQDKSILVGHMGGERELAKMFPCIFSRNRPGNLEKISRAFLKRSSADSYKDRPGSIEKTSQSFLDRPATPGGPFFKPLPSQYPPSVRMVHQALS